MRQDRETSARPRRENERGMALMTTMFFTMLMLMMATAILTNSTTETQISANHVAQLQAFYAAEAGLEQAKSWLGDNRGDTDLMDALLVESQNATPDQSSLTLPDATVVATPLGPQTFANGTYNVVISDNVDDADPLTDSDSRWIITSQGGGPTNASQLIEEEVAAPQLTVSGSLSVNGADLNVDFDQSAGGIGSRVPPAAIDGSPHDVNGNLLAPGAGCAAVTPLVTSSAVATNKALLELDNLRSNIVKRANGECDQFGAPACPPGMTGCCTPELWWVRGSAVAPRFDWGVQASYGLLDLSAPELHATGADYVTITQPPTVVLPDPLDAPFAGAAGNTVDPLLSQIPVADLQSDLELLQDIIALYPAADTIDVSAVNYTGGGAFTYGTATDPKLVIATGGMDIRNGTTFTGFGILSVDGTLDIWNSGFNWIGIVLIQGNNPSLVVRSSVGFFNGALLMDGAVGMPKVDMDQNDATVDFLYSCQAIALAASGSPTRTIGWIALHQ